MKFIAPTLAAAAIAITPNVALALKWVVVAEDQNTEISVDADSVTVGNGGSVFYKVRGRGTPQPNGAVREISEVVGNCWTGTVRISKITHYDSRNRVMGRGANQQPRVAITGTGDRAALEAVCEAVK